MSSPVFWRPYYTPKRERAVADHRIACLTRKELRPLQELEERLSVDKGQTIVLVAYQLTTPTE